MHAPLPPLNRHLIVLIPKAPAFEWVERASPAPVKFTLEHMQREPEAYLVRAHQFEDFDEVQKWVFKRWKMFFERYLGIFPFIDESAWPQDRTLKMFKHWFNIRFQPMVWDLETRAPLGYDDGDV